MDHVAPPRRTPTAPPVREGGCRSRSTTSADVSAIVPSRLTNMSRRPAVSIARAPAVERHRKASPFRWTRNWRPRSTFRTTPIDHSRCAAATRPSRRRDRCGRGSPPTPSRPGSASTERLATGEHQRVETSGADPQLQRVGRSLTGQGTDEKVNGISQKGPIAVLMTTGAQSALTQAPF